MDGAGDVGNMCHHRCVAFSTQPELETLAALNGALQPLGYPVSQKTRVLDAVEAAAAQPAATTPVGPTLMDYFLPAMREVAGPFGSAHAWLRPGDWDYAFRSHFDFLVHEGVDGKHPTHPLFAVEFDGVSAHSTPDARRRDQQKNRLCLASGLPLVRINDTFLHRREQLSLIEWLAQLWAAHRSAMPQMMAERDAEVNAMSDEEFARAGSFLLCERPDLDVDLVFRLEHPFPPVRKLADHLASRYGFQWQEVDAVAPDPDQPRWRVKSWCPATPSLNGGLVERWTCELTLVGPASQRRDICAAADVPRGYPIQDSEPDLSWDAFFAGRVPFLPAGPWSTAPKVLGEALCIHNALIEIQHYLKRHGADPRVRH